MILLNRSVGSKMFTSHLTSLIGFRDTRYPIYNYGASLMYHTLTKTPVSTPLENAYAWVLSCHAAKYKRLTLGRNFFSIEPTLLDKTRIFGDTTNFEVYTHFDPQQFFKKHRPNGFYVADERSYEENQTHPCADMWFYTTNNEVVLIDIGGGCNCEEKFAKMQQTIQEMQKKHDDTLDKTETEKLPIITYYGVVVAPFDDGISSDKDNCIFIQGKKI
jgi:hypothetical protein